jgi:flavoprotein
LDCSFVEVDDNIEGFKVTLDRIKEGIAVLLVRNNEAIKINIPLSLLPAESKKGDILDITIARDVKDTENAKERVSSLLERLKNKNRD